jgi:hypothetical protein
VPSGEKQHAKESERENRTDRAEAEFTAGIGTVDAAREVLDWALGADASVGTFGIIGLSADDAKCSRSARR